MSTTAIIGAVFGMILFLFLGSEMSAANLSCFAGSSENWISLKKTRCVIANNLSTHPDVTPVYTKTPTITQCYIFKYRIRHLLDNISMTWETTFSANFSCDVQEVCGAISEGHIIRKVELNGVKGELYCCTSDYCNDEKVFMAMTPRQQVCYNYSSGQQSVAVAACAAGITNCVKIIRNYMHVNQHHMFFCDDENLCASHAVVDATCKNIFSGYRHSSNGRLHWLIRLLFCAAVNTMTAPLSRNHSLL